ncbi:conserved hypothetical protein [Arthrobacter sp. Hiyo4]|nr:conserved hypothetical protein [Arthrobacter sp. Hiyo4]
MLERLLAHAAAYAAAHSGPVSLHIDVIDPYPAGPGHVWQPGQSRLYLMNTQSFYPTVIPEDPRLAPSLAGTTFDRWRARQQREPMPALTLDERSELSALGSRDFPSRALYGRYLRCTLDELTAKLPDGVSVSFHEKTAVSVRASGRGTARTPGRALQMTAPQARQPQVPESSTSDSPAAAPSRSIPWSSPWGTWRPG